MRELIKALSDFTRSGGMEISRVFDDFLRYVINGFTVPGYPGIGDWNYTKEQNRRFYEIMAILVKVMEEKLNGDGKWYDPFGEIYEELIASKSRRSGAGQFFTPPSLCDLMADIAYGGLEGEKIQGRIISDPTSGSGRTLLSFHVRHLGNYYVAEDLDKTCAMMTVCNFLFHGVEGEVVWHDSLNPDSFFGAWRVNGGLNNPFAKFFGIPHIQPLEYGETYVKRLSDRRERVFRITKKLRESAEKQLSELRSLRGSEISDGERKRRIREIMTKYKNVTKMISKYERG